eukprot:scaffold128306_cov46-Phaeocystis_antarctica.AAC.2
MPVRRRRSRAEALPREDFDHTGAPRTSSSAFCRSRRHCSVHCSLAWRSCGSCRSGASGRAGWRRPAANTGIGMVASFDMPALREPVASGRRGERNTEQRVPCQIRNLFKLWSTVLRISMSIRTKQLFTFTAAGLFPHSAW